jgi:hypothetical protein
MTLEDFYTEVLRKLKVVPPNGTGHAEDRARVETKYPKVHAMLLSEELVQWGVTEAIPDKFALCMIDITANAVSDDFSVPENEWAKLRAEGELFAPVPSSGERQLRKLIETPYVESNAEVDYY